MKITRLFAMAALCMASQLSFAIPLTLNYQVTDLGSTYQYDFDLVLDNNDSTWAAGQQWDWIVFGDRVGGFPNAEAIPCSAWTWGVSDPGVGATCSSGFHQGNTIQYDGSVSLPGWMPMMIGDSLSWSGTSSILVATGDMYWAALISNVSGSTNQFNQAVNVPEPTPFLLLGLGLLSLGLVRRRKA
jgi:hypothetical protein